MQKPTSPRDEFDIIEHVHRLAAWAASRAASQMECRFKVERGERIIREAGLKDILRKPTASLHPRRMDAIHRKLRTAVKAAGRAESLSLSDGIAAKLINVYLKVGLVTIANGENPLIGALHPPVDRQLLASLAINDPKRAKFWRSKLEPHRGWTTFSSRQYETVIKNIRLALDTEERLWMVEKNWPDFLSGKTIA
jgi:hypothetical protein